MVTAGCRHGRELLCCGIFAPIFSFSWETMSKSAAAINRSFASTHRIVNLEIHKVFLRFPPLDLSQNLSLIALADFLLASHGKECCSMIVFTLSKPLQLNLEETKLEYKRLRYHAEYTKPAGNSCPCHRCS